MAGDMGTEDKEKPVTSSQSRRPALPALSAVGIGTLPCTQQEHRARSAAGGELPPPPHVTLGRVQAGTEADRGLTAQAQYDPFTS